MFTCRFDVDSIHLITPVLHIPIILDNNSKPTKVFLSTYFIDGLNFISYITANSILYTEQRLSSKINHSAKLAQLTFVN